MKKLFFVLTVSVSMFIAGCGSEAKNNDSATPGMTEVDLSGYDFNFPITIMVPDSSNGKMEIIPQSWGAIEIKVGENFQISIQEGTGELIDMTFQKSMIDGDEINKVQRYLVDEPESIVYESLITEPEFHFYAIVKAGEASYVVQDIKGEPHSEKNISTMLESAKSIKLKEAKKAS